MRTSSSRPRRSWFEAMWVWQLAKPGITTQSVASITLAAPAVSTAPAGPTAAIFRPLIVTVPPSIGRRAAHRHHRAVDDGDVRRARSGIGALMPPAPRCRR